MIEEIKDAIEKAKGTYNASVLLAALAKIKAIINDL